MIPRTCNNNEPVTKGITVAHLLSPRIGCNIYMHFATSLFFTVMIKL